MSGNNHRRGFSVMSYPFSRDIVKASRYPRLLPLGLFIVFVTWYFWVSLSCPAGGSLVASHICGSVQVDRPIPQVQVNLIAEQVIGNLTLSQNSDSDTDSDDDGDGDDDGGVNKDAFFDDFQKTEDLRGKTISKTRTDSDCDLYQGQWYYDPSGPLYTSTSCPIISPSQNCQRNGRPDKEYENWRWKPSQCELPRFNASKFLELMRGKTLTFVGDSLARNQMESLLCLLWQVEVPKSRGSKHMHRWYFKTNWVTIIRIWSSFLSHPAMEATPSVPDGITRVDLDNPDEHLLELAPRSDVIVIDNGHWFTKKSAYFLGGKMVGAQSWAPLRSEYPMNVTNLEAFRMTTETMLTALGTHPDYSGLTILVSYSPDHYENGAWNSGGSCTGKSGPVLPGKLVENEYTKIMHRKQVAGFNEAVKKKRNRSKLKLLDITEVFGYRHDGHPGPYRSMDPNKVTKVGPNGRPPPQDCLHWCMPGPVDVWNELMLETIRREFEAVI